MDLKNLNYSRTHPRGAMRPRGMPRNQYFHRPYSNQRPSHPQQSKVQQQPKLCNKFCGDIHIPGRQFCKATGKFYEYCGIPNHLATVCNRRKAEEQQQQVQFVQSESTVESQNFFNQSPAGQFHDQSGNPAQQYHVDSSGNHAQQYQADSGSNAQVNELRAATVRELDKNEMLLLDNSNDAAVADLEIDKTLLSNPEVRKIPAKDHFSRFDRNRQKGWFETLGFPSANLKIKVDTGSDADIISWSLLKKN